MMPTGTLAFSLLLVSWAALDDEYHQDFRKASFDYRTLHFEGHRTTRYARTTAEGLSIEMPVAEKRRPYVWIRPQFTLHGDFEITATFTILEAEVPPKGRHTGARLDITEAQTDRGASVAWYSRTRSGSTFRSGFSERGPDGKKQYAFEFFPTESRSGKLRLSRQGTVLSLAVSEDNADAFREIRQLEFGAGDIEKVRLGVDPGHSVVGITVLWQDLTVRGERILLLEGAATAGAGTSFLFYLAITALLGGVLGAAVWRWRRRRGSGLSKGAQTAAPKRSVRPQRRLPSTARPAAVSARPPTKEKG